MKSLSTSLAFQLFRLIAFAQIFLLAIILAALLFQAQSVLSWQFITRFWNHIHPELGGVFPAIVGSLYLGVGVMIFSFPVGFATALYLTEYTESSWFRRLIELAIRNLAGVPSVVYGLFGLAVFVHGLALGTSVLAAILTLSIMTLPWIITAAIESLESLPRGFREASLALGANRWQTTYRIILPAALPTGITGGIIALARAMGETAPIIMVGATFYLSQLPTSPLDKFMALPYHTFILATQHADPHAPQYAAATACILIFTTVFISLGAIALRWHLRKQKEW